MRTGIETDRLTDNPRPAQDVYRKVMWRIMPLLFFCYVVAFLNRQNVGFAKLQFMHDLRFNEAVYGLGGGLFYLGYILCEIPSNLYVAKRGLRSTLLRIMVLWGLCSAAMAFMKDPTQFYVLRGLLGAAEAGLFPGVLLYLTYWIPTERRAYFTVLFMFSIGVSGSIGGPLSGAIMRWLNGVVGLRGWQWLFLIDGLPSCVLGVVAYLVLSNDPSQAKWLTDSEKAVVLRDLEMDRKAKAKKAHSSFGRALRDHRFYLIACMAYALLASVGGVFLWLPTIIRDSGIKNIWDVGLMSAVPFVIAVIVQIGVARHSDKQVERRWHTAVPALAAAVGWVALPLFLKSPELMLLMLTLATTGSLAAMGPFWTMPSAILSGTAGAAGIALITTVGGFGGFISPIFVGWIASRTGSLVAGLYYFAAIMLLGAIAVIMVGGERPSDAVAADQVQSAAARV
jgi:MFS family permease